MATGYNIYRGLGGLASVDFDTPVATVSGAAVSKTMVGLGHLANSQYTYVIRPVLADLENPAMTSCEFVTDGSADWLGNRPAPVMSLDLAAKAGATVRVQWTYRPTTTAAADFGIFYGTSPGLDVTGAPDETVTYTKPGR